jgi:hypothetical protein
MTLSSYLGGSLHRQVSAATTSERREAPGVHPDLVEANTAK